MERATAATARAFLEALIAAVSYQIHTVLTDNGIQFADPPKNDVGRRIAHERSARAGLAPARMAAIGIALVLGTGVDGLTAASAVAAPKPSIFASADALAPSTLLEGRR
ncbi:MAG: hypothetical protein HY859_00710 [Caulobacterales bacterium]|nr:hypothetical protein [Caulobacterales bacterium]